MVMEIMIIDVTGARGFGAGLEANSRHLAGIFVILKLAVIISCDRLVLSIVYIIWKHEDGYYRKTN